MSIAHNVTASPASNVTASPAADLPSTPSRNHLTVVPSETVAPAELREQMRLCVARAAAGLRQMAATFRDIMGLVDDMTDNEQGLIAEELGQVVMAFNKNARVLIVPQVLARVLLD